ncbi:DUF1853 family protein [Salegentibacter chungangensis]|uniref:DUF1853 family protein n=1 Tax=Salegentibacter chungangensis TaxID=1335724 RepID=A0ABW3NUK2_9FLAO
MFQDHQRFEGFWKTPSLWKEDRLFGLRQFNLPVLDFREAFYSAINSEKISGSVLGKRVERFFEVGLQQQEDLEIITANLQISREKITLGEIDFLVRDKKEERVSHIELVYKFYVYDPTFPEELARWIGPNRRDSLLQKTEKLKQKQLPLLYKPETKEALKAMDLDTSDIRQEVCFKANLFVPKHLAGLEFPLINNQCIAGYWISFSDFSEENYGDFEYFTPVKKDWPVNPDSGREWFSYKEIKEQIKDLFEYKKAPLVWMKKGDEEYERLFVVWW